MGEMKKCEEHCHNEGSFCYQWNVVFKGEGKLDITHFTTIISENTASFNLAVIFSCILPHMNIFMKSIYS